MFASTEMQQDKTYDLTDGRRQGQAELSCGLKVDLPTAMSAPHFVQQVDAKSRPSARAGFFPNDLKTAVQVEGIRRHSADSLQRSPFRMLPQDTRARRQIDDWLFGSVATAGF
jgi:hypothetical protein